MRATDHTDHVAIRAVIDRFAMAVTACDAAGMSATFTEDADWTVDAPLNRAVHGAEAIGQSIASGLGAFQYLVQMVHSAVIDIDGDTATARSIVQEIGKTASGEGGLQMIGIYHDTLRRDDTGWRFVARRFAPISIDKGVPGGDHVGPARIAATA